MTQDERYTFLKQHFHEITDVINEALTLFTSRLRPMISKGGTFEGPISLPATTAAVGAMMTRLLVSIVATEGAEAADVLMHAALDQARGIVGNTSPVQVNRAEGTFTVN